MIVAAYATFTIKLALIKFLIVDNEITMKTALFTIRKKTGLENSSPA